MRSKGKKSCTDAAYSHRASSRSGTLVCYENHKTRDNNAAGMRLYPSEISWQSYQSVKTEDSAPQKQLRAIAQHFVIETETRMVLYQAAQESSYNSVMPR